MSEEVKEEEVLSFSELLDLKQKEKQSTNLVELPKDFFKRVRNYVDFLSRSMKVMQPSVDSIEQISFFETRYKSYVLAYKELIMRRISKIIDKVKAALASSPDYIDKSNMTDEEKQLFWDLYEILKKYFDEILNYVTIKELSEIREKKKEGEEKKEERKEEKREAKKEKEARVEERKEKVKEKEKVEEKAKIEKKEEKKIETPTEYVKLPEFSGEVKVLRIIKDLDRFVWKDKVIYGPFKKEDIVILGKELADMLIKGEAAIEIKIKEK